MSILSLMTVLSRLHTEGSLLGFPSRIAHTTVNAWQAAAVTVYLTVHIANCSHSYDVGNSRGGDPRGVPLFKVISATKPTVFVNLVYARERD